MRILTPSTVVITTSDPAPPTEIVIVEDDTCGVIAADPAVRRYEEHPIDLYNSLHRFQPYSPGHLRRQGNVLHAMVIELESDPICTAEWIGEAAYRLVQHPLVHTAKSIRLQMLGCIYAAIDPETSFSALEPLFDYLHRSTRRQLYLQVQPEHKAIVSELAGRVGRKTANGSRD